MEYNQFIAHFFDICNSQEIRLANPHKYFKELLSMEAMASSDAECKPTVVDFLLRILYEFEVASIANRIGNAYLFYRYFTDMLFKAISIHALLKGNENWLNPTNYLQQIENEIEQKFIYGLFPEIYQEIGNKNKAHFIDWFGDLLDKLGESNILVELPISLEQIKQFFWCIYRRDYLVNFRAVEHLQNVFRSPNIANFLEEPDILENFLLKNNISQIINLRGEQKAKSSPNVNKILEKCKIKLVVVNFNEPKSTYITGTSYKMKVIFLKGAVYEIFQAILQNSGATLIHCAAGKDRTGIITALLQKLTGLNDGDIVNEYRRSGLDTRPEKLLVVLDFIEEYGGIEVYLEDCGFNRVNQEQLKAKLKFS